MDLKDKWDYQLRHIILMSAGYALNLPKAMIGVAVDDNEKRDYFAARLQQFLDEQDLSITFRIVPLDGQVIEVKKKGGDNSDTNGVLSKGDPSPGKPPAGSGGD